MRRSLSRFTIVALLLGGAQVYPETTGATFPPEARGDWEASGGSGERVRIEAAHVVTSLGGKVAIARLERHNQSELQVRSWGLLEQWEIAAKGDTLRLTRQGKTAEFHRLREPAPDLELKALPLGNVTSISPEQVAGIQTEIAARIAADQKVRQEESPQAEVGEVDRANCQSLRRLFAEIGWVERRTFGASTAGSALVLAKHCNDLSLMMTLLPFIERDFKNPGNNDDAQVYAVFYDGLQLALGNKQKYGSQLGEDRNGNPMVLPLEDVERVDQLRKELGLAPLAEYLELASKFFYEGRPIRLPRADE